MPDSPQERYERLQEILQEAILREYPNPERKGCVGPGTLQEMARRLLPVRDANWEHVTHCSPCYREFLEFRADVLQRESRSRLARRRLLIAAAVLIAIALGAYLLISRRTAPAVAHQQQPPASGQSQNLTSAVLNLESQSETRGSEERPVGEIQRLPQKRLALSIYLPFGSEPGEYQVHLLNRDTDTVPISTYAGTAEIENGLTVLRLVVDLSSVSAGPHVLATRRGDMGWRYFRFVVG